VLEAKVIATSSIDTLMTGGGVDEQHDGASWPTHALMV
jgi:hypothetical protein